MNDFIGAKGVGMVWPGPEKTRSVGLHEEWGIRFHDNDVVIAAYDSYAAARRTLDNHRDDLRKLNIPELYWPIMVSRTVETIVGSWRHTNE